MLLGAHFSVKQGLVSALKQAESIGCQAIQIFGYRRHEFYFDPRLDEAKRASLDQEIRQWHEALSQSPVRRVSVHSRAVALIALKEPERRKLFLSKFKEELSLAQKLGAHEYVFHLGPYSEGASLREGLDLAVDSLREVIEGLPVGAPRVLLENVPGGGRRMGGTLEELAFIINSLNVAPERFGLCLDFAHLWGAGYELDGAAKAKKFFTELDNRLDAKRIAMLHLNNSKLPLGCHLDEHSHLNQGGVGIEAYAYALERCEGAVGILETPKDEPGADARNLDFLKTLQKASI